MDSWNGNGFMEKIVSYFLSILYDETPYCKVEDPPLPSNYRWFFVIDILELCLMVLSLIVIVISASVFLSVQIFHRNTVRMFGCVVLTFPAMQATRLHLLYSYWSMGRPLATLDHFVNCNKNVILTEYLRYAFMVCYYLAICALAFERLIATIFLETYEKKEFWWSFLIVLFLQTGCCAFTVFVLKSRLMSLTIMLLTALLFQWVPIYVFLHCKKTNEKRYMESRLYNSRYKYSLTAMYQLSDNIRATKCMIPGIWIISILNTMAILTFFASITSSQLFYRRSWLISFNMIIACYTAIAAIIPLYYTSVYRSKLNMVVKRAVQLVQTGRISPSDERRKKSLKTLGGTQMVFALEDEGNIYFQTLLTLWK